MLDSLTLLRPQAKSLLRPRLAFAGVGWIGRDRLEALAQSGLAEIAAVYDPREELASAITAKHACTAAPSFTDLLADEIDAVVIATPSALHAQQAIEALNAGKAVFCQKPLARNAEETRAVVEAARNADQLLGVDFSYRFTRAMKSIHALITSGELGDVYAAELKFHNAYGPDKAWFYDRRQSGGGCLLDLGIHLVDLAHWTLGSREASVASGVLRAKGQRWSCASNAVEDYAAAQFVTDGGASVQLACSWHAHAGTDAVIEATFYGTQGGACFKNVNGSFYDFTAEQLLPNRTRKLLASPPDKWGGGAVLAWLEQLCRGDRFDPAVEGAVTVAETLDRIYASASQA